MRRLFSFPISICEAVSTPRTPPSRRSRTAASSSSRRPSTTVARSAHTLVTCRPVIVAARFSACEPMSPIAPAMPERAGSVRHEACLFPVASSRVASQPWLYWTTTLRSSPSSPRSQHVARVPDERIAGVVVGDAEHAALALRRCRPARSPARSSGRAACRTRRRTLPRRTPSRRGSARRSASRSRRSRSGHPPGVRARARASPATSRTPARSRGRDRAPTRAPASDPTRAPRRPGQPADRGRTRRGGRPR